MAEAKGEAKVSSKAMEAAMVARLFKDAMESGSPIVGHFVWERDDGQSLDLGLPKTHPSFPNPQIARQRLEQRIGQWVSGEKPGVDKNAIARLEAAGLAPFDFSMESFEKAALADDGSLIIGVGMCKGVGREPMEIAKVARLRLYSPQGEPIGRRQALLPIKEIINIQKREREAQAKRLASQEQQIDEGVDLGRALALEEDRQWSDMNQTPSVASKSAGAKPLSSNESEAAGVAGYDDGMLRAMKMMDLALTAVGKNMGSVLGANPLPVAEAKFKSSSVAFSTREPAKAPEQPAPIPAEAPGYEPLEAPPRGLAFDRGEAEIVLDVHHSQGAEKPGVELVGGVQQPPYASPPVEAKSSPEAFGLAREVVDDSSAGSSENLPVASKVPAPERVASVQAEKTVEEIIEPAHQAGKNDDPVVHKPKHDSLGAPESKKPSSQVRIESPGPKIDPEFLRAVFPDLPDGVDEVLLTVDKSSLFDVLESLEDYGRFEMRIASRGDKQLSIGICVPAGKVAILSDFVSRFSKGGIMVKRHS